MNPPAPPNLPQTIVEFLVLSTIAACIVVWVRIIRRWLRRLPVLPYQPRRRVPWRTFDVILLVSIYILIPALVVRAAYSWFDFPRSVSSQTAKATPKAEHPLSQALLGGHDVWTRLLCIESAVIIAPITEELLFRLLLQGWLESLGRRMRRRLRAMRWIVPGLMPITTVAVLFAALHIPGPQESLPIVVLGLSVLCISGLLTIAATVFWLKVAAGATWADLGIVPGKLAGDIRIGLAAFLAAVVPVYMVMIGVKTRWPTSAFADPLAIFFLAIPLGILYYRTHRIVPSLALHMAFNAVGVFVAITMSK
jgi:membrane protease YdiL (CAAX protease family)